MLNKEEKRLVETYVIPLLDRVMGLCMNNPNEIYGDKYLFSEYFDKKEISEGKEGLYVAFSKIWSDIFEAKKLIEGIIRKKYVESMSYEQKEKQFEKKIQKEEELHNLEEKNREKLLKNHKKEVIAEFLKENRLNFQDIINKKSLESFNEGREKSKLSDKEILNKAELIKLNKEILEGIE